MYANSVGRTLERYLEEISRIPVLTTEEEAEICRRIQEGDEGALADLTRANLRFVVSVAKKYQGQGMSLADLISEGNHGLLKAAQRFDITRGFKFISYAVWWIRQAILEALSQKNRTIRKPLNWVALSTRVRKARGILDQRYGRDPTEGEIASYLEEKVEKVRAVLGSRPVISLHASPEDDSKSLIEVIPQSAEAPDDTLVGKSKEYMVRRALSRLEPRDSKVLQLCFGIGYDRTHTLEEIGDRIGLTRERVRQIKMKALRNLEQERGLEMSP